MCGVVVGGGGGRGGGSYQFVQHFFDRLINNPPNVNNSFTYFNMTIFFLLAPPNPATSLDHRKWPPISWELMTHGRYSNVKIATNSRSNGRFGLNDNQLNILLTMACIPVFLPVLLI